jgi:hypothetical protein
MAFSQTDLRPFVGVWEGDWERTNGPESGAAGKLVTTFALKDGKLVGSHFGINMTSVDPLDRTVIFKHPYGSCEAEHTFTISLSNPMKADSTYVVDKCTPKENNHTGKVHYTKQ